MKKIDPKKTVLLIDGSSFLYRAYYGVPPLHTPQGEPIQAVYSFIRMIKKLINTFSPEYMVVVWDSKGKTTRHELFKDYKATREAAPSDLFTQKEHIVEFADLIGLRQIAQPVREADDIMYSIAQERNKEGGFAVFITSDKDMSQAITPLTFRFDPFKNKMIDEKAFEEKWGFSVEKLPFYFALAGDTSDNIPGVRGIGKKGATELAQQFDSLQDLFDNLKKVEKKRMKTALEKGKEDAFLSEKLFLLQYEPSRLTKEDLSFDIKDWSKARPLFEKLNFKTLTREIDEQSGTVIEPEDPMKKMTKYNLKKIITVEELQDVVQKLKKAGFFGLDTETNGLNPLQANLVGMSFSFEDDTGYYLPLAHKTDEEHVSLEQALPLIKPLLEDPSVKKYLHNVKFDAKVLKSHGINVQGHAADTMIMARLLAQPWQKIGLKDLSVYHLGDQMLNYKEVVKDNKLLNFSYVPLDLATRYAAADALQTLRLYKILQPQLEKEGLADLYQTLEHPMIDILTRMEMTGIYVDASLLKDLSQKVARALTILKEEINRLVDTEFEGINLNSPMQVGKLLFDHLGLPTQKKSAKKTSYSTDQEVLEILSRLHPVPALILKYRELAKLKNTYLDALPTYINPKTGRVHTTYSQTVVVTGRLASSDPNLQNIPVSGASGYGIEVRAAFKPQEGHVFLSADYSQIELRILAHLSGDENLMKAFLAGHDIHAETASRLFDVPLDQVTSEQRQVGKRINFSILYGLTPYGLSKDLHISFKEAKNYIDKYFEQYPGVLQWMETVVDFAKEHGYVQTVWGRRRYVPGIRERNKPLYQEARRVAINTVAQGTAADIIKKGMIDLDRILKEKGLGADILLQIHDELLISVPEDQVEETEKQVKSALEGVVDWKIPLTVTTRIGRDWKEITK